MDSKLHTYNFQLAFPGAFYGQAWLPHMYKAYRLKCDVVFGINKLGPLWQGAFMALYAQSTPRNNMMRHTRTTMHNG